MSQARGEAATCYARPGVRNYGMTIRTGYGAGPIDPRLRGVMFEPGTVNDALVTNAPCGCTIRLDAGEVHAECPHYTFTGTRLTKSAH